MPCLAHLRLRQCSTHRLLQLDLLQLVSQLIPLLLQRLSGLQQASGIRQA